MIEKNNTIKYVSGSWQGSMRESNKDETFVIQSGEYYLFFIFDGVSSSTNARSGIELLRDFCKSEHAIYFRNGEFGLRDMMEDMNLSLLKSGLKAAETTCCVLYISRNKFRNIKISHLGDSRIYGLKKDSFLCYTKDDNDPVFKNILTKCMGLARLQESDFYEYVISDHPERFLLCTDGFYNVMEDAMDEFRRVLRGDLSSMVNNLERLIIMQNADDATFMIVDLPMSNP